MKSFEDYRDRMIEIVTAAEKLVGTDRPGDTDALDQCRARMSRILTAYHLYADRELFTPCVALADPAHRVRVREISAECAALAAEFRSFARECTANPVIGRWAEYRVSAQALMARIRRHLAAAETEVRRCEALSTPMRQAG